MFGFIKITLPPIKYTILIHKRCKLISEIIRYLNYFDLVVFIVDYNNSYNLWQSSCPNSIVTLF